MTISSSNSKTTALGNGSTTVFSYNFLMPAAANAVVIYTDANGNQTTLTASQYAITGINNPAGGTVTYPTSGPAIASGTTLTIQRVLPLTQPTSISNQGAFYPGVVESGLDTATMLIQQIAQGQAQSLKGPVVDSSPLGTLPAAAQRANQLLGFDGSGNPIAAQPSSALVSTIMQPVVGASSIAQAVGLLGVPSFVGVGTTTGTANAQVMAATVPGTFAITAGNKLAVVPSLTNTTAMTLTVGLSTYTVLKRSQSGSIALSGGEVVANQVANFTSDGTNLILDEPAGNSIPQSFRLTGAISPAMLPSGNTNNYAPSGLATASTLRISANGAGSTLTGLAAQPTGTVLIVSNVGSGPLVFAGQNGNSSAANQFLNSAPVIVLPGQSTALQYDGVLSAWQIGQAQTAAPTAAARKNLKIVTTSVTASTITADELILEDPNGATYRATNVNVSYATGTSGANGLDTGSMTASNWYYEYTIFNPFSLTLAALISLSSTAPTMPAGFTFKARAGAIYFDAGSKLRFKVQYDRKAQIVIGTNPTAGLLMASGTPATYTAIAVGTFVPSTAAAIALILQTGGSGVVAVSPNNNYGASSSTTNPPYHSFYNAGGGANGAPAVNMTLESTNIYYTTAGSTGYVFFIGWEDSL